jgi:hypothetical protein
MNFLKLPLTLIISLVAIASSEAATIRVLTPYTNFSWFEKDYAQNELKKTIGELTFNLLTDQKNNGKINFVGSVDYLKSINDFDDEPTVHIGNIRYVGWCFKVNGVVSPVSMNDETALLKNKNDLVEWFYGYYDWDQDSSIPCKPLKVAPKN